MGKEKVYIKPDDLAVWYKEHAQMLGKLSSMEICNENHDCNEYVARKINAKVRFTLNGSVKTKNGKENKNNLCNKLMQI